MQFELFASVLTEDQISQFISANLHQESNIDGVLCQVIRKCTELLNRMVKHDSQQEKSFFENYRKIIEYITKQPNVEGANGLDQEKSDNLSENMAVHWIILFSQRLLENNHISKAKYLLKKLENFIEVEQKVDCLLLSNGLNNLSMIYRSQGKYDKSSKFALKIVNLLIGKLETEKKQHIFENTQTNGKFKKAKKDHKDPENFDYGLILVNACVIIVKNIKDSTQSRNQQNKIKYLDSDKCSQKLLLKYINNLGYKVGSFYLGKNSQLMKNFTPVIKNPVAEVKEQLQNLQSYVNKRLLNIQKKLSKEPPAQQQQEQQQNLLQQEEVQQKEQKEMVVPNNAGGLLLGFLMLSNKVDQQVIQIAGWSVHLELLKKAYQTYGKLQIHCVNKVRKKQFTITIGQSKLGKILHLQNLQDTVPYEYCVNDPPIFFIRMCIKPYFNINQDGDVQILPRSKGLLLSQDRQQKLEQIQFMGFKCYFVLHNIRYNKFRVAISPVQSQSSLYLNIELNDQQQEQEIHNNQHLYECEQVVDNRIFQAFKSITSSKVKLKQQPKEKSIQILDHRKLKDLIRVIIVNFEAFILGQQNSTNLTQLIEEEHLFYKFVQLSQGIGTFYRVKFRSTILSFDLYAQNSHPEQDGKKLKGTSHFTKRQFQSNFGLQLNYDILKHKIKYFSDIISQKYFLPITITKEDFRKYSRQMNESSFQQPQNNSVSSQLSDNFQKQNYLVQQNFNFHYFKLSFLDRKKLKQNSDAAQQSDLYVDPITVSIITIQNRRPIGIKVSHYSINQIEQSSFFIHIVSEDWMVKNFVEAKKKVLKPIDNQSVMQSQQGSMQMGLQGNTSTTSQSTQMFVKYEKQYEVSVKYFLSEWMQKIGFQRILEKASNPESNLFIRKNKNQFVRWGKIFQEGDT